MYIKLIDLVGETSTQSKKLQIPSEAPSGVYQLNIPGIYNLDPYIIRLFNQGKAYIADPILNALHQTNPVQFLVYDNSTSEGDDLKKVQACVWNYDSSDDTAFVQVIGGAQMGHTVAFVKHLQGTPTDAMRFEGGNEGWSQGQVITNILIHQIA